MFRLSRPFFSPEDNGGQGAAPPAPPTNAPAATPPPAAPTPPPAPVVGLPDEATLRSQAAAMELQSRFSSQESQIKALNDKIAQLETARSAATNAVQTAATKAGSDDDLSNDPAMLKLNAVETQIKTVNDALLALQKSQEEARTAEADRQRQYQIAQRRDSEIGNINTFFKNNVIPSDPDLKTNPTLQALVQKDLNALVSQIDFSAQDLMPQYNRLQLELHRSIKENKALLGTSNPGVPDPTTDARGAAEARDAATANNLGVNGAPPSTGVQPNAARSLQRDLAQRMMDIYTRNGGKL